VRGWVKAQLWFILDKLRAASLIRPRKVTQVYTCMLDWSCGLLQSNLNWHWPNYSNSLLSPFMWLEDCILAIREIPTGTAL